MSTNDLLSLSTMALKNLPDTNTNNISTISKDDLIIDNMKTQLSNMLVPSVVECDKLIHSVIISQRCLNSQLDKLTNELAKFDKEFSIPSLTPYINSLYETREKINVTNATLSIIHNRIERIRALVIKQSGQSSNTVNDLLQWDKL